MEEVKEDKKENLKEEIETKNEEVIKLGPSLTCIKGGHFFIPDGVEMGLVRVKCTRCPIGYYLPHEAVLREGHVFINEMLMI